MDYQFSALCYIRFLSALLAVILVFFLSKRRKARGAAYLMIFEMLAAIWAFSDGMEAAAPTVRQKLFWSQVAYIGITNSAVMFLMFSLSYTRNKKFTGKWMLMLLLIIPVITIVLAFTNPLHKLLWSGIEILPGTHHSMYYYGPWFWVHVTYQYSLIISGMVILIAGALRVYTIYRIQTWLLLISVLLPFAASILYVFKLMPIKGVDFTPVAFIFTGIIIGFSLYRLEFFNIVPIAHRQTIDNLDDGMVVVDARNRVMNINPAFTKVTGIDSDEIKGDDYKKVLSYFRLDPTAFSEQNEFKAEARIEKKGDLRYYEIRIQPVTDSSGRKVGKLIIIRDNTLNKMILDAITESNISRKKELDEKEKLIRDLDAYARMVAHDLKNPLSAVNSFTYLMQDALKSNKIADISEMVEMLQGESNKMIKIIDDLLMLSRIRKEDLAVAPIDINSIISEAIHRQHNLIYRKDAIIHLPDHWPAVYGQSQWVEQVWINLINNALKYGGVPPVITLGFEKVNPSLVRFWIKDNGKGLSPESRAKLFNDFERLGNKDAEGTGLGLSIVKRIINKMRGDISVESANIPGEGCIFSFTLPTVKK